VTRSTIRVGRRGLTAALVVAAAAAAAGCGAGLQTETSRKVPSVPGANQQVEVGPHAFVAVRNVIVRYPGPEGYPQGEFAPVELRIFNDTDEVIRLVDVEVADDAERVVQVGGSAARETATPAAPPPSPSPDTSPSPDASPGVSPGASPSPAASPSPPAPAGGRVDVEIPARGYVVISPDAGVQLRLVGLTRTLRPGDSVTLTFRFSNNVVIRNLAVPVDLPASPLPRSPMVFEHEGEAGHG
jgi:hypothetical protein